MRSPITYFTDHILPRRPVQLLMRTGLKWQQDNCSGMAAAISYHALFSLFPILLVILSVLGSLLGPNTQVVLRLQEIVEQSLPPDVWELVYSTVDSLYNTSRSAGLIGFGLLLYSASTVFSVLSHSVNQIWQDGTTTTTENQGLTQSILTYLLNRLTAFLVVLGSAALLLVSMISDLIVTALLKAIETWENLPNFINIDAWIFNDGLHRGSSFFVLALVSLLLLKILPNVRTAWKDLWPGALLAAALLLLLQQLIARSVISIGSRYLSYGVIGSVMILLLWIYFTCQIFLIGCEFSYAYSRIYGSRRHR